ncbi:MAG: hypothetical protein H6682_22195 [Candidatus Eisenbacteria bacterium]|nr:hypothetical protein [Candidatus Eisenbacteria bacterium]
MASDLEGLKQLSDDEWRELIHDLRLYTEFRIWRYTWNPNRRSLPRGLTADDIVLESICDVLSERRTLPPCDGGYRDAFRSIIDSKLHALVKSAEQKRTVHYVRESALATIPERESDSSAPEAGSYEAFMTRLRHELPDELWPVAEGFLIEGRKPRQISQELDRPIKRIYEQMRRVRKASRKIWKAEHKDDDE